MNQGALVSSLRRPRTARLGRRSGRAAPRIAAPVVAVLCALAMAPVSVAQLNTKPAALENIDVYERRGQTVALDVEVIDSEGQRGPLRDYFKPGRPVLLNLVYYDCPMLCTISMSDTLRAARDQKWEIGQDYEILTLSFNHRDTIADAARRKAEYAGALRRPGAEEGWRFLVTTREGATRVTDSVGYAFQELPNGEFSHPTVMIVLTPEGVISTYLYGHYNREGVSFNQKQLELSLQAAADGKLGNIFDKIWFSCYVHTADGYVLAALNVMRVGAVGAAALLVGFVGSLLLVERRKRRRRDRDPETAAHDAPPGALRLSEHAA